MVKNRVILAVCSVLLFLLLSITPGTATVVQQEAIQTLDCVVFGEDGTVSDDKIYLNEQEETEIQEKIGALLEKLQSVRTYRDLLPILDEFSEKQSVGSIFAELFENIDDVGTLGKRSFVVSFGRNPFLNPFRKLQITFLRPESLFWFYVGSDHLIEDTTIIVDPYPFNVKVFDGRQIGFMRRFVGLYVYKPAPTVHESYTFFVGYARSIIGLDLSPLSQ